MTGARPSPSAAATCRRRDQESRPGCPPPPLKPPPCASEPVCSCSTETTAFCSSTPKTPTNPATTGGNYPAAEPTPAKPWPIPLAASSPRRPASSLTTSDPTSGTGRPASATGVASATDARASTSLASPTPRPPCSRSTPPTRRPASSSTAGGPTPNSSPAATNSFLPIYRRCSPASWTVHSTSQSSSTHSSASPYLAGGREPRAWARTHTATSATAVPPAPARVFGGQPAIGGSGGTQRKSATMTARTTCLPACGGAYASHWVVIALTS